MATGNLKKMPHKTLTMDEKVEILNQIGKKSYYHKKMPHKTLTMDEKVEILNQIGKKSYYHRH